MNKQKLFLILVVAVAGITAVGITSNLATASSVDTKTSTIGYTLDIPNDKIVVKRGETLNIPVKILTDTEKALDLKMSVTEFPEYPEGRAPLEEQVFTRGISASLSDTSVHKANGIIKDENVNVTFIASSNAELGERILAITALEGSYPNQSFVQSFVSVTIVE